MRSTIDTMAIPVRLLPGRLAAERVDDDEEDDDDGTDLYLNFDDVPSYIFLVTPNVIRYTAVDMKASCWSTAYEGFLSVDRCSCR